MKGLILFAAGFTSGMVLARLMYHNMYKSAMDCMRESQKNLSEMNDQLEKYINGSGKPLPPETNSGVVFRTGKV